MDDPPDKVTVQHNYPQAAQIFLAKSISAFIFLSALRLKPTLLIFSRPSFRLRRDRSHKRESSSY